MIESAFRLLALAFGVGGMALLALAQKARWNQLLAPKPYSNSKARWIRAVGSGALGTALVLCLRTESTPIAVLVWLMGLTGSALIVAFVLAYQPRWLTWLTAWAR